MYHFVAQKNYGTFAFLICGETPPCLRIKTPCTESKKFKDYKSHVSLTCIQFCVRIVRCEEGNKMWVWADVEGFKSKAKHPSKTH